MGLLKDDELRKALGAATPQIIENFEKSRLHDEVYGCAIYLHIGDIFLPGSEKDQPGSNALPVRLQHCLQQGETAVLRTKERFKLSANHAAVVFPSSSVSMQGLLMTNPGHVDPGYEGPLHVTVINMGSKPYALQPNERFLRALIFEFDAPAVSPLKPPFSSPITQELLQRLSQDFLDVTNRAKKAAKDQIDDIARTKSWLQFGVPALFALFGVLVTSVTNYFVSTRDLTEQVKGLQDVHAARRLDDLENRIPTAQRLDALQREVDDLKAHSSK
jgi:dCTP deaminase